MSLRAGSLRRFRRDRFLINRFKAALVSAIVFVMVFAGGHTGSAEFFKNKSFDLSTSGCGARTIGSRIELNSASRNETFSGAAEPSPLGLVCQYTLLNVAVPPGFWNRSSGEAAGVWISIDTDPTGGLADFDLYVYRSDINGTLQPDQQPIAKSAHSFFESSSITNIRESTSLLRPHGYYLIEVRYQGNLTTPYTGTVMLTEDFTRGQVSRPFSPFEDDLSTPENETCLHASRWFHTEVEPFIAADPVRPEHVVGAWQQDRDIGAASHGLAVAVSFDAGDTWRQVIVPGLSGCSQSSTYELVSDPWLTFGNKGELFLGGMATSLSNPNAILVSSATDYGGGLSWGPATPVAVGNAVALHDKPTIKADPYRPGYIYATWQTNLPAFPNEVLTATVMFSRSSDGGQIWEPPRAVGPIKPSRSFPGAGRLGRSQLLVMPGSGRLVVFFSDLDLLTSDNTLSVIRSSDQGLTWDEPIVINTWRNRTITDPERLDGAGQPKKVRTAGTYSIPEAAVDPNNGNLYVVWEDGRFGESDGILFSMSRDAGDTWTEPLKINQTPTNIAFANQQAFTPMVAVAQNGTVAVTYYDFRFNGSEAGLLTDYWMVFGNPNADGGLTRRSNWGRERRLTDASFDMERAPETGTGYMVGDYQGLAAVSNRFITFFSQPHGTDHASVFSRRVPGPW